MHALDWPFVSELERAQWKARCLRCAGRRLAAIVREVARALGEALAAVKDAQQLQKQARDAANLSALRQQLKAVGTTLRLDTNAAVDMVGEALALTGPILSYVALGDC